MMTKTRLLLPLAALSALALAACDNPTGAPDQPNPDAGDPPALETPSETPAEEQGTVTDDLPTAEEIEQQATETFESIMEETQQAGDQLVELGGNAMQSISEGVDSAADAIETQIDSLVAAVEETRDDNLTEAQKLDMVANTRNAAEQAARALGASEEQIESAGDTAEQRAREVLGL